MLASSASIVASAFVLLLSKAVSAQVVQGDGGAVWGGLNLTTAALLIQGAISSPTCNATENCQTFVNQVVPLCLNLKGEAGCWCGNHNPLHYCALCMSNPTDNSTSPDQTQDATNGHTNYHRACGVYGEFLNSKGTSISSNAPTGTAGASSSGSSSGTNAGTIAGAVVGGVVGLAIVVGIIFLVYRRQKQKEHKLNSGTSVYSEPKYGLAGPPSSVGSPPPHMTGQTPPPGFNQYMAPPTSPGYTNTSVGYTSRDSAAPTEYDTSMFKHLDQQPNSIGYSRTAEPM
ncbi:hypothetical protein FRC03_008617 [Tulasnella sp. 419]|nr:hypothetical protein FRC02_009981 [Tulasnella sp. 418]KAG8970420.1 hypothetical protein FRC03_008617 [Tulasnella sp. 419]